jgi:hypothetical protein
MSAKKSILRRFVDLVEDTILFIKPMVNINAWKNKTASFTTRFPAA